MDGPAKETVETYLATQHALDREAQGHAVALTETSTQPVRTRRERADAPRDVVDARWPKLGEAGMLTRLTYFEFDPDRAAAEFGAGGAQIVDAHIEDEDGAVLAMSYGGEIVRLTITAQVHQALDNLIFGFYFKDRLGQRLFGDNTFQTYTERPVAGAAGEAVTATFSFRMPVLPSGIYSIDLAVASGSQDNHTQQHWLHDALEIRASDTSMKHGLIGLPMLDISIRKKTDD
jgi:lipopolysaccharide transport system ATP-binding protein